MSEHRIELTAERFQAPQALSRIQVGGLVVGTVALALAWLAGGGEQFYQSYLVAYLFWLSISLGSLGLLLIQHMTQGDWGLVTRRINEASAATLTLLAVLFLPIWTGLESIYKWTKADPHDHLLAAKLWFLNKSDFGLRVIAYFVIFLVLTWLLIALSSRQDKNPSPGLIAKMRAVAAPGIVLCGIVVTLVSVDLLMSLDPHWYSSMYGVYFIGTILVAGMTFLILMGHWLSRRAPMNEVLGPKIFYAQGKLLLAFVMLWAYFGVSQLVIIWAANLPEEIVWYQERTQGGWLQVGLVVVFGHFFLPFLMLLSRSRKHASGRLARVAALLLAVHFLDYYWQAAPTFHHHLTFHWLDVATLVGLGGLWLGVFATLLKRRPLVPVGDAYLPEVFTHE